MGKAPSDGRGLSHGQAAAGGLAALQQAAMLSALPFTIIVALLGTSLILELRKDPEFELLRDARLQDISQQGSGADRR